MCRAFCAGTWGRPSRTWISSGCLRSLQNVVKSRKSPGLMCVLRKIKSSLIVSPKLSAPCRINPNSFCIRLLLLDKQNKKAGTTRALTTGEVYDIYRELCKKARYNCLTQRRTADLISELDMLGIITARVISKGRHGRTTEIQMSSSSSSKDLLTVLQEDDMFKELANYKMKGQARLTV